MARKTARPGRSLIVFGIAIVAMYVGLALHGVWSPKLGLDLQGGTLITLEASTTTGEAVTPEKLKEAAGIIDSRVNAYGVAESAVSTQGNRNIVVEIPGKNSKSIVNTVKQTAQLRFRLVAAAQPDVQLPTPSPSPSASPGSKGKQHKSPQTAKPSPSPAGRAVSEGLLRADKPHSPSPKSSPSPSLPPPTNLPTPQPSAAPGTPTPVNKVPTNKSSVADLLAWANAPDTKSQAAFQQFTCAQADKQPDNPAKPLLACDKKGTTKYLLSPAMIEGTQLDNASSGIPQNDVKYVVNLDFNGTATGTFGDVTRALVGTQKQ